jgi:hypothetical protein
MYTHEGIDIYVKINYLKQQISLVDVKGNRMRDVQDKLFRFNNTNGKSWPKIMDSMKCATESAIDRMEVLPTPTQPQNIIKNQIWEG